MKLVPLGLYMIMSALPLYLFSKVMGSSETLVYVIASLGALVVAVGLNLQGRNVTACLC